MITPLFEGTKEPHAPSHRTFVSPSCHLPQSQTQRPPHGQHFPHPPTSPSRRPRQPSEHAIERIRPKTPLGRPWKCGPRMLA